MAFTAPILTKLEIYQRHCLEISYAEFHKTRWIILESKGIDSFRPWSEVWLSLGYFRETHNRVATSYKIPYNDLHENSTDGLVPDTRLQMDGRVLHMRNFIILIVKMRRLIIRAWKCRTLWNKTNRKTALAIVVTDKEQTSEIQFHISWARFKTS